ncbi:MAG: beta-lactamase family protein [Sphingomonadaceae bacterium]|nr:beta-lactamase family protein [Sphingomonadaceae bacterium]
MLRLKILPALALLLACSFAPCAGAYAQQATPVTGPDPAPNAAVLIAFDRTGAQQTRVLRGLADRQSGRMLGVDDPVRVASISKMVVALAVMRLVDQRVLDLDADVSTYLGWRLRHPRYPDRPITLAMLLGHRSGLADGMDYALPLDVDLEQAVQNPAAWDASRRPGGAFAYANINFPLVAAVMEGATGERFDRLMQRLIFAPLRIDACFNWSGCSDAALARAVVLYRPNGDVARDNLHGAPPACLVVPARDGSCDMTRYRLTHSSAGFSPQGGLRISARGMARIGELLLREGERLISRNSWRRFVQMRRVDALPATSVGEGGEGSFFCRYGLAIHQLATRQAGCRDDPVGDGAQRIGHSGDAYSLRSGLFIDPESGTGLAWFVTGLAETGEPRGTRSAFTAAEEALLDAGQARLRPVRRR